MDATDLVRIEIEHLAGQMTLEVRLELVPSRLVGHVKGSSVTWQADGVRITVPAGALEHLLETLSRLADQLGKDQPAREA